MQVSKRQTISLLAGGAGFLGSHLCDRLVQDGHLVLCLDNLLTGTLENLSHLVGHNNFSFVERDISERIDIADLGLPESRIDYVLHFASPASPKDYLAYPIDTLKAGAFGTYNALNLARATGATFLLASTSEVYGDPMINPQPESYWGNVNPIGPRSVYDEAKRYAEAMTLAYHRVHGVPIRIARIFNTYGPRMCPNDGRALPNFIAQALKGHPLTIYGSGLQTRSFCYVDDLVEGLMRLLYWEPCAHASDTAGALAGKEELACVFNLGNPSEITIMEFARAVLEASGSSSELVHLPLPQDDPHVRQPDIAKARALLGWQPTVDLYTGLRKTLEWFKREGCL
ncbi:MAG: SDR family oxidoreductase [Selenomonadales bacterium]|nr:SDR family oxidoreductase [Selenomonadales bacterium]